MSAPRAFEHAHLRVRDLSAALDFYRDVMGLVEIAAEDGVVYLGAGLDENYDLAISAGGTGVEHFAIRVDTEEDLDALASELVARGVPTERHDGTEPGQVAGLRLNASPRHAIEFVTVADSRYLEPYRPALASRGRMGLLDVDHINLAAANVRELSDFLCDALGFRCSDLIELDPESWLGAWLRRSEYHHDVAVLAVENADTANLHHLAWTCASLDHMKSCLDLLAEAGIRLELGVGRHPAGSNLFAYFWDPGGNRTELTCEVALVEPRMPTRVWPSPADTLDAWSDAPPPDSFRQGS